MATSYQFPNINCTVLDDCQEYILNNIDWADNFSNIGTGPLTVYTVSAPLTDLQLSALTTLLNAYVDPVVFLRLDHVDTFPLHSHYTSDQDNTIYDGNIVLQTFIFSAVPQNGAELDGIKTIIEYACPNVQNFLNITSGNSLQTGLSILDITRNLTIASQDIDISDTVTLWNNLAQTGVTGGNIQYKSIQYSGIMNKNPGYDCIWQLTSPTPHDTNFTFRVHSLQYLWYVNIGTGA